MSPPWLIGNRAEEHQAQVGVMERAAGKGIPVTETAGARPELQVGTAARGHEYQAQLPAQPGSDLLPSLHPQTDSDAELSLGLRDTPRDLTAAQSSWSRCSCSSHGGRAGTPLCFWAPSRQVQRARGAEQGDRDVEAGEAGQGMLLPGAAARQGTGGMWKVLGLQRGKRGLHNGHKPI